MSEFRYQRLLEIKEKLLEHKQTELEVAIMSVAAVVEHIHQVEMEIADTYRPLTTHCMTGKEVTELLGYLSHLDTTKVGLLDKKSQREQKVAHLRSELLALEIELKILEKLRDKALRAIKKVQNKKEQKLMDELALRRSDR
jgi:flagellar export protein FliJ